MTDDDQNNNPPGQTPPGDQPGRPEPRKGGKPNVDQELEDYRTMLDQPTAFEDGFGWTTVLGALFCGVLMFPGAIYLGLLTGQSMNMAARWVTVIIFSEVARRALKPMSKQQMVVLLMVAGAMISGNVMQPGGPFGNLIFRQFLVQSDAVKDAGIYGTFPDWWAPAPDSGAIQNRTFFHMDWLMPIGLILFVAITNTVERFTIGYGLYRLTSDVEKLPFPMSPVGAQGMMALSEGQKGERTWRWTAYSIGAVVGLGFGAVQAGVPAVTSAFLDKPITPIPIPWLETTPITDGILPAVPTGIVIDLGLFFVGMVIPFWAVVGSALSVIMMFVLNPILHSGFPDWLPFLGQFDGNILTTWQPGMDTINTQIANEVDFYFSMNLGMAIGVTLVSLWVTYHSVKRARREAAAKKELEAERNPNISDPSEVSIWTPPPGRGDWSLKLCIVLFIASELATVALCKVLVPSFSLWFLLAFAFIYTPTVSYLNAKINGIAGQSVDIPFVREAFILLSGAKGVEPWLVPIPIENYGETPEQMRTFELTGTKLYSKIKAWLLTTPLVLLLGFVFWSFLWTEGPIPSDDYPFAQKMWELAAKRQMIMWSATTAEEGVTTLFERSFHPEYIGVGAGFSVVLYSILAAFGAPTMLVWGLIRGIGQVPHGLIVELFGAALAKFYLRRKFGVKPFLQTAPILLAGYLSGLGLVSMGAVAIRLILAGISQSPL